MTARSRELIDRALTLLETAERPDTLEGDRVPLVRLAIRRLETVVGLAEARDAQV